MNREEILDEIVDIYIEHLGPDGWDIAIMEHVAQLLVDECWIGEDHPIIAGYDDARFLCDGCGRIGTVDDLCAHGEPCPDEECDGTTRMMR